MYSDPVAEAVSEALVRLLEGTFVGDIESQLVDCKEPLGTVDRDGIRLRFSSLSAAAKDDAARQLAGEVACLAHGGGGALIVGVRDDRAGVAAIVGTDVDPDWLRLRIHELTVPSLTVSVRTLDDAVWSTDFGPVLVVQVPPAVEIHGVARRDGTGDRAPRWRVGRTCQPMSAADQATFARRVRPVDWSASPTTLGALDVDQRALAVARSLQPSLASVDDESLLNRLGLLDESGRLVRAGALLFAEGEQEVVVFTVHDAPGAPSRVGRVVYRTPLLVALQDLLVRLETVLPLQLFAAEGAVRNEVRVVPMTVVREAIANALAHRDWSQPSPITISVTSSTVVEVVSPGGFPDGVNTTNVLSHPSRPTNPTLAHTLNVLQISERQGVGVDLMFREMAQQGHQLPEIDAVGTNVRCRIVGGEPDQLLMKLFSGLGPAVAADVEIALVVHLLRARTQITADELSPTIQRSRVVASAALQRAADSGLVERTSRVSEQWRLTKRTREVIGRATPIAGRRSTEELIELIARYAQVTKDSFSRSDIEVVLNVAERRARQVLNEMTSRQWLSVVGTPTGRSVRYARGARWKDAVDSLG
jgi:ATP-dependent DNA helicase RecG